MIFTRVIFTTLLVASISAHALYIPDVLYAREFEESRDVAARELFKRGLDDLNLNVARDLAFNNEETVLAARGNEKHSSYPVNHPHGAGEREKGRKQRSVIRRSLEQDKNLKYTPSGFAANYSQLGLKMARFKGWPEVHK